MAYKTQDKGYKGRDGQLIVPRPLNMASDYFYYNLFLINQDKVNAPAKYFENRLIPLVEDVSKWMMSVNKFVLPMNTLPLMPWIDNKLDPTDINYSSEYAIGLAYTSADGAGVNTQNQQILSTYVKYIPRSTAFNPVTSERFIFYYTQMVESVNIALQQLWTTASATAPYNPFFAPNLFNVNSPPYILLENGSFKFHLPLTNPVAPGVPEMLFRVQSGLLPPNSRCIEILMSYPLFTLFSGFPVSMFYPNGGIQVPNLNIGLSHRLLFHTKGGVQVTIPKQPALGVTQLVTTYPESNYFVYPQDYSSLHSFQQVQRVLFLTDMRVVQEVFNAQDTPGTMYQQAILTEFTVPSTIEGTQRDRLTFDEAIPRYNNFQGSGPLNIVDIKIFFQTNTLELYPLNLAPGDQFLIKLQFKRRKNRDDFEY